MESDNLDNRPQGECNSWAMKITKYFRDQQPPTDENSIFVDNYFPPNNNSIWAKNENGEFIDKFTQRTNTYAGDFHVNDSKVVWMHAKDILPGEYAVFANDITPEDINQGDMGDCYFLSAIASLAEFPDLLVEIFRTLKVTPNGCYEVVMKIHGEWQVVLLDSYFPCDKNTKRPIFCKPSNPGIWSMLLEKAWAKVNGGYYNMVEGACSEVLKSLTNFPAHTENIKDSPDKEVLWKRIVEYEQRGYIMDCATHGDAKLEDMGLVKSHSFTLLNAKEANVDGENVRLLRIRNPWGYKSWKGDWSATSDKWTAETKEAFGIQSLDTKDDGCFWIGYSDFLNCYGQLSVCHKMKNICTKYLKCDSQNFENAHVYELTIQNKSKIYIQCDKEFYRFDRAIPPNARLVLNIILVKKENNSLKWIASASESQKYPHLKTEVDPGSYLVYAIANYKKHTYDQIRPYMVEVFSDNYFNFQFIGFDLDFALIKEIMNAYVESSGKLTNEQLCYQLIQIVDKTSFGLMYIKNNSGASFMITGEHDFTGCRNIEQSDSVNISFPNGGTAIVVTTRDDIYEPFCIGAQKYQFTQQECEPEKRDISKFMEECQAGDIANDNNYNWMHRSYKWDISSIAVKIDQNQVITNFIQTTYPEQYALLSKLEPLNDGVEVLYRDKFIFDDGSYYIGQWTKGGNPKRHGLGYFFSSDVGLAISFKDEQSDGIGFQCQTDGTFKVLYEKGQFIKVVDS